MGSKKTILGALVCLVTFLCLCCQTIPEVMDRLPNMPNRNETQEYCLMWGESVPIDYDNPQPYTVFHDNVPFFEEEDFAVSEGFEFYSELDELGRCGYAFALITPEIMPTEERTGIGHIKPTGWHTVKYQGIDGNYLYNRCHLIAFSLAGENDNEKNLITGTRYMNTEGMLPFEMQVLEYVRDTGNPVLYRVTPFFDDDDLVARGVLIEAQSTQDDGISFCVFCYNMQPGIQIDYGTGESIGPAYE